MPNPTASTSGLRWISSDDRFDDRIDHRLLRQAGHHPVHAVVDLELLVDDAGEQLRAAEVDSDHLAAHGGGGCHVREYMRAVPTGGPAVPVEPLTIERHRRPASRCPTTSPTTAYTAPARGS